MHPVCRRDHKQPRRERRVARADRERDLRAVGGTHHRMQRPADRGDDPRDRVRLVEGRHGRERRPAPLGRRRIAAAAEVVDAEDPEPVGVERAAPADDRGPPAAVLGTDPAIARGAADREHEGRPRGTDDPPGHLRLFERATVVERKRRWQPDDPLDGIVGGHRGGGQLGGGTHQSLLGTMRWRILPTAPGAVPVRPGMIRSDGDPSTGPVGSAGVGTWTLRAGCPGFKGPVPQPV